MNKGAIAIAILIAAGYVSPARGQGSATTLVVGLENVVEYWADTSDLQKWGTDPNPTTNRTDVPAATAPSCLLTANRGNTRIWTVGEPSHRNAWTTGRWRSCGRAKPALGCELFGE